MKRKILILPFLLFFGYLSQAQIIEDGCIKINFETILNTTPTSGMNVGDQYYQSTGVRFALENGNIPVLAGIGPPQEAYQGPGGAADSGPDDDLLGQFILTDDGFVVSPDFSPLIISFENPIDSLSAIILDLDFDEIFEITAFGASGEVVFEQTIASGDPFTGDGRATPFGFNLESCTGSVHSISFVGSRMSGGFGLGMDNFIFCFEGVDLLQDLDTEVTDIFCQGNLGAIQVINNSDLNLMYSIDGNTFNSTGLFTDLPVGDYLILVEDENGCQAVLNEDVEAQGPTTIEEVIITHTSCGEDNGSFEVIASQDNGVVYYYDQEPISNNNVFTDVAAGTYQVTIIGPTGCSASLEITIDPSQEMFVDEVLAIDDSCQQTNGSITVNSIGGDGELLYSINNGQSFQSDSIFNGLTSGFYEIVLQDENLCTVYDSVSIFDTPGLSLGPIMATETLCDYPSGTIEFLAEGGYGNLEFQINDGPFQDISSFSSLEAGEYSITIRDELGCIWEAFTEIEIPICPIYIPNVFTPEASDLNTEFRIYTMLGQDVQVMTYEIYDRWGLLIYSAYNFDIYSDGSWWQGKGDGVKWASGVYAYKIDVEYYNGTQQIFTGDITLLR